MMAEDVALGAFAFMLVGHMWSLFDKRIQGWMLAVTVSMAFGAFALVQATDVLRWASIIVALGHLVRAIVLFQRDRRVASGATPAETSQ